MSLIVQKFGGTSLADPASREMLVRKVTAEKAAGNQVVLVVSAMGRRGDPYATDTLLDLLKAFPGGADGLVSDLMASCGEVISACVIAALLKSKGIAAEPMTAYTAGFGVSGAFGDADPAGVNPARMRAALASGVVPVVTGFQGVTSAGDIATLGRGGSDTSAVAIGAALGADFVDIYKDVPGVALADPRLVPEVPYLDFLDYDSMFRLANLGARVLHDKSALLAKAAGLRMRVRPTFDEGEGTLIGPAPAPGNGEERSVPSFLGLATSAAGEGAVRLVAVFAEGGGSEKGIETAKALARKAGATGQPCGDPHAAAFLCSKGKSAAFAAELVAALAG
jgi:aspartate kinase